MIMRGKKVFIKKLFLVACLAITFLMLEKNFSTNEKVINPIREIEMLL
jgi:hypothetical protein